MGKFGIFWSPLKSVLPLPRLWSFYWTLIVTWILKWWEKDKSEYKYLREYVKDKWFNSQKKT